MSDVSNNEEELLMKKDIYPYIHFLTFCDHFLSIPLPLALQHLKLHDSSKWESYQAIKENKPVDEDVDNRSTTLKQIEDKAREELRLETVNDVVVWREDDNLGELKREWWGVAKESVCEVLKDFGLEFVKVEEEGPSNSYHIVDQSSKTALTKQKLSDFLKKAEQKLLQINLFSYSTLVSTLVSAITSLLTTSFPDIFPPALLAPIYSQPTTPFGEEWSVAFDIAFEGGGLCVFFFFVKQLFFVWSNSWFFVFLLYILYSPFFFPILFLFLSSSL